MRFFIFLLICSISFSQNSLKQKIAEAEKFENQNNLQKALEAYVAAIEIDSTSALTHRKSANLLCEIGFLERDKEKKRILFHQAIRAAKKAVRFAPSSAEAHYTLSASYGRLSQIVSTKEQMALAQQVKDEADLAVKLDPKHDLAWHVIGKWNFRFADLSWFEKTIANTIFGEIPEDATFENALHAFEKAIEINPNNIAHLLEKAKTLIELDREKDAKYTLFLAIEIQPKKAIDHKYLAEAKALLDDI